MSSKLRSVAVALFASLASSSALAAELVVVNRCPTPEGSVHLGAVERGGACNDCVAVFKSWPQQTYFRGKLALGERATLSTVKGSPSKLFAYVAGSYRLGVEIEHKAILEIVPANGERCELRKVDDKRLASSK